MGRKGVQALKHSALWDISDSRCGFSLECFLQVVEGTRSPEDGCGKSYNLRGDLICKENLQVMET